jgi:hypothetical protein
LGAALNPSQRALLHVRNTGTTGVGVKHHSGQTLGKAPPIIFVDICGGVRTLLRGKLHEYVFSIRYCNLIR